MTNDFQTKSYSSYELVLNYQDALAYLDSCSSDKIIGWEGWLLRQDGALSHSQQHQGTVDLSGHEQEKVLAIVQETIIQSYQQYQSDPEIEYAKLLFCITTD